MNKSPEKLEYKVLTIQDIETSLYSMMQEAGIASPVEGESGKLRITDIDQAKSQNSMSVTLNKIGKDGWELVSINNSQLYIFQRPSGQKKHMSWQYKVLTLADIDKLIFSRLIAQKAAEAIPNQPGKYKILDVEKAKSQVIMAEVMTALGKEGWILSGVNKSDLYFFRRLGEGAIAFNPAGSVSTSKKVKSAASVESNIASEVKSDVDTPILDEESGENAATDSKAEAGDDGEKADSKAEAADAEKSDTKKEDNKKDSAAEKKKNKKAD